MRSIINAIPDEIVVKDLERKFVIANEACLRALGKQTEDQVVGLRDEDLVPERFVSDMREKENRVLTSGEALINDLPKLMRDEATGEIVRAFLSTKTPLRDRDGRLLGLVVVNRDTTQLHRALETLGQSESRFRTVWDNTLDGMRLTDAEGTIVMVNRSFCKLFKKESEELIGRSLADTYLPNVGENIVSDYCERFRNRTIPPSMEAEVTVWNGEEHWLEISNAFISVPGQPELLLSVFRDITERLRAEAALRASQEQFRIAQDMSPDGFTILQPLRDAQDRVVDFTWIYENAAVARLNGTDPQAVVGKRLLELFPGHRGTPILRAYQQVAESNEVCTFEADYSGESIPKPTSFRLVVVPMNGNIAILAQDITERKLAEEQLRAAKDQYQQLVENINEVIFSLDDGGTITYVSPAASVLGGYIPAELSGHPFSNIVLPEDLSIANSGFWRVLRGEMGPSEFRILTKSGDVRWVRSSSRPIVKQGTVEGISGVLTDITDRKLAEERLNISQEQLHLLAGHLQSVREEERKHLAQEFHDQLGQTLTAIKMDLSMLRRASADTSRELSRSVIAQSIESAQDMIDRAIVIIREILSELRPELLDQLGIVPTLEWEVDRFQRKSGISSTFSSSVDAIALDASKAIALYRIFQEAVTNVARHAKATRVEVTLRDENGVLSLEIKDNGIGISANAEQQTHSFGLIGMRERAILLGGTIEIHGTEGKGTTVRVRIPFEQLPTNGGVDL